jgi:ATP-dependent Lon protease
MPDEKKEKNRPPMLNKEDENTVEELPVVADSILKELPPSSLSSDRIFDEENTDENSHLRIIPVRNTVLFPHNVIPLTSGKEWSMETIDRAIKVGGTLGILTQKNPATENPGPDQLFEVGTEAKILKVVRFPDNSYAAVVQGIRRFRVEKYLNEKSSTLKAKVSFFPESQEVEDIELIALGKGLKQLVQKAITLSPNVPGEASLFIENVQDPAYLADLVIPYLSVDFETKQALLEIEILETRLRKVHLLLTREVEILEISQKIHADVRNEVGKHQRKYYVREQLKLLQKELGELEGRTSTHPQDDPQSLKERIESGHLPVEAREAALREVDRMSMMQTGSPEFMVSFTYVNWILDIPWNVTTQTPIVLKEAKSILNSEHFGLEKVKKRILEYLAVYSLKQSLKGPILLLNGPPGVGKTSLGKSIAKALGRKFIRISLGGIRDEGEIRGHRRTYIGSMPGKIIDALKKSGSMDPVVLLDEVDKLSGDFRGDPANALLEVLDAEQNHSFIDNYLNIPVDLSKVMFIATANNLHSIPGPLRDRMEIVELSGYTLEEKAQIASRHLLPKVIEEHGLSGKVEFNISDSVLRDLIQSYTREAGVRQLSRELATIARSVAVKIVDENINFPNLNKTSRSLSLKMTNKNELHKILGAAPFLNLKRAAALPVGVATGLAYTPVGGDVLLIESAISEKGSGKLSLTGQLGDIMKESVQTALAYIRANRKICGIESDILAEADLHVHFPAGAVKKDGPSAGVAVFLAMVGQFSKRKLNSDLAMTGEISLRGDILPVGGIKEKLLAAHRYGIKRVLIPQENAKDLEELSKEVLSEMKVIAVSHMKEALEIAFGTEKSNKLSLKKNQTSSSDKRISKRNVRN